MYPLGHLVNRFSIWKYPKAQEQWVDPGLEVYPGLGQSMQLVEPYVLYVSAPQHTWPPSMAADPPGQLLQEGEAEVFEYVDPPQKKQDSPEPAVEEVPGGQG